MENATSDDTFWALLQDKLYNSTADCLVLS